MDSILFQAGIPFFLSAFIVILITVIAERYGTKVGGILGTLPSTIVIAFLFFALNQGVSFASRSAIVVPAEMGINVVFLFVFVLLAFRSTAGALVASLIVWIILSTLLFMLKPEDIFLSLVLYAIAVGFTLIVLEKVKKTSSVSRIHVHYTPLKIATRGVIAGTVIAVAVLLSNIGPTLSGIFSVFPAIFMSTMLIYVREHGPGFATGMAKAMIFGTPSVLSYAVAIHFFYPLHGIYFGSMYAYMIAVLITIVLLKIRGKIR